MHARTESHLAPPCWYSFPVSQTFPLVYTSVHNLNRYLAISTSILTLVLQTCNHEMLFWLLQQALLLPHHVLVQYWHWSFIFTSCTYMYLTFRTTFIYSYTIWNKGAGGVWNKGRQILVCSTVLFFGHTTNRWFFCFLEKQHISSYKCTHYK